jgi:hypothetical protein
VVLFDINFTLILVNPRKPARKKLHSGNNFYSHRTGVSNPTNDLIFFSVPIAIGLKKIKKIHALQRVLNF